MTAHLHIGLAPEDLIRAHKVVRQSVRVFVDGDGWEVWGDRIGKAGNDQETVHMVLEVHSGKQARRVLAALQRTVTLVPMRAPHQRGTTAVLTSPRNWSHDYQVWTAA